MVHSLATLPYAFDALAPTLSAATLSTHWGKHHRGYLDTVNRLVSGSPQADASLASLARSAHGELQNAAAQAWNHEFLWHCMSPDHVKMSSDLRAAIDGSFGSLSAFEKKFTVAATHIFGSGWLWLTCAPDGRLALVATPNAGLRVHEEQLFPLITCDVWEHAYYLDYKNERGRYVDGFFSLINWAFASERWARAAQTQTHDDAAFDDARSVV